MMRMAGKRALVTGSASGIGKAVVASLVREGAEVIGADIAYHAGSFPAGENTLQVPLDVTDESQWERVLQQVVRLDALVACAGISDVRSIAETSLGDWRRVTAVNLDGAFLSLKYGARMMREHGGGSIVLVGSASGVKAASNASAYCASKAAVRMLVKAAALELKPEGIRVNCVSPAGVVTPIWSKMPFWQDLIREQGSEEAAWNALGGADPGKPSIQRMAFPDEIANAVLFLTCNQAAHVTGADLAVDAGYTV
jgi:2-keto-3-deoxy-L-fuconate dehydrogenase